MKRVAKALAVALVVAAMVAPGAAAQEGDCTFQNGKTTCTQSVFLFYQFDRTELVAIWNGSYYDQYCDDYAYPVYETTTTVYRGKSEKVLSTSTSRTQGESVLFAEYRC
jgi:hypothetical protein